MGNSCNLHQSLLLLLHLMHISTYCHNNSEMSVLLLVRDCTLGRACVSQTGACDLLPQETMRMNADRKFTTRSLLCSPNTVVLYCQFNGCTIQRAYLSSSTTDLTFTDFDDSKRNMQAKSTCCSSGGRGCDWWAW